MPTMTRNQNIAQEVQNASQEGYEPEFEEEQLREDQENDKLLFSLVTNEMKQASQEAISKQTIQAYMR